MIILPESITNYSYVHMHYRRTLGNFKFGTFEVDQAVVSKPEVLSVRSARTIVNYVHGKCRP